MPFRVTEFESTPNPNAVKCHLDGAVSEGPRSFLNAEQAQGDPLAAALFAGGQVTCVLFNGGWITVNKTPPASWDAVKRHVRKVLATAARSDESR